MRTREQIVAVVASMGLTLLAVAGSTVLLVREIRTTQTHLGKTQERILDRLEDIEKHVDWTGRE